MNEQALAELIKQTVEATSNNGTPNYTILASVILLAFALFALLTKYMGGQIIKNQEQSSRDSKLLLDTLVGKVEKNTTKITEHEIKIAQNQKNISRLWDEKEPKRA